MHPYPARAPRPWLPAGMATAAMLALVSACSQGHDSAGGQAPVPASESGAEGNGQEAAAMRIPARFQGEWQGDPGACGRADEGRLLIGPQSIRFPESHGGLQALHAEDERLDVALQLRGEGRSWEATYRFRLSDDGRRLADLSSGNGMVRLRCRRRDGPGVLD